MDCSISLYLDTLPRIVYKPTNYKHYVFVVGGGVRSKFVFEMGEISAVVARTAADSLNRHWSGWRRRPFEMVRSQLDGAPGPKIGSFVTTITKVSLKTKQMER
jgi:hypothetical protein